MAECYPPSKSQLEVQRLAALVFSPYLAYSGLFQNHNNQSPVVRSREPDLNALRRRSFHHCAPLKVSWRKFQVERSEQPARKISMQLGPTHARTKAPHRSQMNYLMARIDR